jgi:hypothetical protein
MMLGARPTDDEREGRRRHFDDPGVVPSHAYFEDFLHWLEVVLQGVPKGMWMHIQDEGVLEQCVGLPTDLWVLIRRAVVAAIAMTGRFPTRPEGPLASGAPPPERGPGGDALEVS